MHSPTLVAIAAILMFVMTLMLLAAWRFTPRIAGLKQWALAFACGLLVCLNVLLRDQAPEWLLVACTQLSGLALAWLNLEGAHRYLGHPPPPRVYAVALAGLMLGGSLYYTLWHPDQGMRFLLLSSVTGALFCLAARRMLHGSPHDYPARYLYVTCCALHGGFLLLRSWLFPIAGNGVFDVSRQLVLSHLIVVESIVALVLLGFCIVMLGSEQIHHALRRMAEHDSLTGVYNRLALHQRLARLIDDSQQRRLPLSVLLMDVDHFKRVNDTWGHQRGDEALCHVVDVARRCLRDGDQLGRLGGEEFAILLPATALDEARQIASRLRQSLAEAPLPQGTASLTLSASIGLACWQAGESPDSLLNRADAAMYRAKRQGRDRVEADLSSIA